MEYEYKKVKEIWFVEGSVLPYYILEDGTKMLPFEINSVTFGWQTKEFIEEYQKKGTAWYEKLFKHER